MDRRGYGSTHERHRPLNPNSSRNGREHCASRICRRDVVSSTKYRVLDVIGLALAGVTTPFGESLKSASAAMNPPGAEPLARYRAACRCRACGVRERRAVAGAGVRRHAQRVHRAHEQSCGGCCTRAGGEREDLRPRADYRCGARQRNLVPCRQRCARSVSSARISSHRIVRAVRHRLSRRANARIEQRAVRQRRRHRRQLRGRHSRVLGRRHAIQVSASGLGGAERHHGGVSRARRHDRTAGRVRWPLRFVRFASAGQECAARVRPHHRGAGRALGESACVVQAVSRSRM